jgi:hypothetical protein
VGRRLLGATLTIGPQHHGPPAGLVNSGGSERLQRIPMNFAARPCFMAALLSGWRLCTMPMRKPELVAG